MNEPTEYIVAMGNAFFLKDGTVFAAPILADTGTPDWEWDYEIERQDDQDPRVLDSIIHTLHTLTVFAGTVL